MLRKSLFVLVAVLLATIPLAAQTGWMRDYGEDGHGVSSCIQQTNDGGYIISSCTKPPDKEWHDAWLIKTDENGDTVWTQTFGGDDYDIANYVTPTANGGYILTGMTHSFGSDHLLLIKTDANGNTEWLQTYGTGDFGTCVQETSDGGYVVLGGAVEFGQAYTAVSWLWILKTDDQGDTLWTRVYGLGWNYEDWEEGRYIQETSDGNYIITGLSGICSDLSQRTQLWLFKTDTLGEIIWSRKYGEWKGGCWHQGNCVLETDDGGYIVAGRQDLAYNDNRIWLLRTNGEGDTVWTQTYGEGCGNSVDITSDDGYIVTASSLPLIKTDGDGNTIWTRDYGIEGHSVQQTLDGGFVFSGVKRNEDNEWDLWATKTDSLGNVAVDEEPPVTQSDWQIPVSVGRRIVLQYTDRPQGFHAQVFDASGRKVDEIHASQASGTIIWGDTQTPGVYFIRSSSDNTMTTRKVILVK